MALPTTGTVRFSWGDMSPPTLVAIAAGVAPPANHAYAVPGTYSVVMGVFDGTGAAWSHPRVARFIARPPVPPTITGPCVPATGPAGGGTSVGVPGTGFLGATSVGFAGVNATGMVVNSDISITCTTPPGATGAATVEVRHPAGNVSRANSFVYT